MRYRKCQYEKTDDLGQLVLHGILPERCCNGLLCEMQTVLYNSYLHFGFDALKQ